MKGPVDEMTQMDAPQGSCPSCLPDTLGCVEALCLVGMGSPWGV